MHLRKDAFILWRERERIRLFAPEWMFNANSPVIRQNRSRCSAFASLRPHIVEHYGTSKSVKSNLDRDRDITDEPIVDTDGRIYSSRRTFGERAFPLIKPLPSQTGPKATEWYGSYSFRARRDCLHLCVRYGSK